MCVISICYICVCVGLFVGIAVCMCLHRSVRLYVCQLILHAAFVLCIFDVCCVCWFCLSFTFVVCRVCISSCVVSFVCSRMFSPCNRVWGFVLLFIAVIY